MKKILIATGIFPPDIGGPATYADIINKALTERGFSVKVVTYSGKKIKSSQVVCVSKALPKGIRHLIYFLRLLLIARKVDIILALNAVSAGLPAFAVAKFFKKKFIVRIVGDYAWEIMAGKGGTPPLVDDYQKNVRKSFLHKLQVLTCRGADQIIVPSEYLKKIVKNWGVNENKIIVIYNGVDLEPCEISKEDARTRIGIHGNILISAGRLVPWKGFRMLIKVMPKLLEINQFFRLVIIGDGPERKSLEQMVRNLGLDKRVYLVDKKPKGELTLYFAASDIFILNTSYEGFSHQILEAMALRVPVIVSAIPGNREIIHQGQNGFLVKYNDEFNIIEAVKTLHRDPELKEQFVAEGEKTASYFSTNRMMEETIKILRDGT